MPFSHLFARRALLVGAARVIAGLAAGLPSLGWGQGSARLTPACADDEEPTPAQTEGPFFSPSSPERSDLREAGVDGAPVRLSGLVLSRACHPIAGALVELWHADADGNYDNEGYRCRGHVFTGPDGGYVFETVVPGLYPGRTRHFHVKYQAPSASVLTTQLYFPGEPGNISDRLFRSELLLALTEGSPLAARFDAVLDVA